MDFAYGLAIGTALGAGATTVVLALCRAAVSGDEQDAWDTSYRASAQRQEDLRARAVRAEDALQEVVVEQGWPRDSAMRRRIRAALWNREAGA